jgi:FkbM family methyltransferase
MSKIDKVFELVELEELELLKPDFIKIDIEGAEKNLLKNSSLIKQAKYIYIFRMERRRINI